MRDDVQRPSSLIVLARTAAFLLVAAVLAGCAAGPGGEDRFESTNRAIHGFNKGLDTVVLRPASRVYGNVVPEPIRLGLTNVAANVSLPGKVINHALQGDVRTAANMAGRFAVNSTYGVLGLVDVAGRAGVPEEDTDFGETLHVWGVGEGAFIELPFLGPSTSRDAVGAVVDSILNPLGGVTSSPESEILLASRTGAVLNTRFRFGSTIDSVLYDSADSYAQSRLAYLQTRRFALGDSAGQEASFGASDTLFSDSTAGSSSGTGDLYDDLYFE